MQISESDFSVSCVASPICDASGQCVATVSIVLPEHKVLQDRAAMWRRCGTPRRGSRRGWAGADIGAGFIWLAELGFTKILAMATMASISTVMLPGRRAEADGRARVPAAVAEHLDQQVRAAVDDLGVFAELGHGVDHAEQLDDALHPVEIAERGPA